MSRRATRRRRAFSLTEVLLAVFILGIGVIAIAALFPAGIAQQQQSADDIIGPIVANNALAVLRTKVRPEDVGTYEAFLPLTPLNVEGDWRWSRPAFFTRDTTLPGGVDVPRGSISIFNDGSLSNTTSSFIPWNPLTYDPGVDPPIIITQGERYYPMFNAPPGTAPPTPSPQYVWECMFRRFQGKVLVAIFVYRVVTTGGSSGPYVAPPYDMSTSTVLPVPVRLDLIDPTLSQFSARGPWGSLGPEEDLSDTARHTIVAGTAGGNPYNPGEFQQSWQEPRQWILDQNNNLHRVLSRTRQSPSDYVEVELVRPVPPMPPLPAYYFPATATDQDNPTDPKFLDIDIVGQIWYMPAEVLLDVDGDGTGDSLSARLTPVYATVREL